MRVFAISALLLGAAIGSGCATPIGVDRASPRSVHRELVASALSTGSPSAPTQELLTRQGLRRRFDSQPDAVIAELHAGLARSGDADRLFALSELSFLRAERTGRNDQALAAAVYAYAFLFPGPDGAPPDAFDPRTQIARHLYNRGLALGLASANGRVVELENARRTLPFGTIDVLIAPGETTWAGWHLEDFVPVSGLRVRGLANRYRHPGVGAPLAAALGEPAGVTQPPGASHIPPALRVPVTAFLRIDDARAALASGHVVGRIELYSEDERPELLVEGRPAPLEVERSSALALALEGSPIWDFGLAGFRLGDFLLGVGQTDRLIFLHPFRPNRIPVVLVHGTFSSPAAWAEMVNELENDPEIGPRYQIWLFLYNTGNPIPYSAGILTQTLRDVVATLDPQGQDAALRHMVVIGHSQGGLLTKLTAVDSGDAFWANVGRRPFAETKLRAESRALLERSLFYQPLPFVRRVVFLSTPHRGSFLSDFSPARWVSRLVKMPVHLMQLSVDLFSSDALATRSLRRLPTSLDNMASNNWFLKTLSGLPIAPGITAHSIIPVRGDLPPEGQCDGVVCFASASIDGVESELVVPRSGHSVQTTPQAIQEVRRILLENAAELAPAAAPSASSRAP